MQYVTVVKDSQIVGCSYIRRSRGIILYEGLCCVLSGVCHITGRRRKGKGLVGPFRYNYYREPTKDPALIRDPAYIFVIMLFSPAIK